MKCAVLGAGAWGTALASLLSENGHETTIWCLEPDVAEAITQSSMNPRFLPGIELNGGLLERARHDNATGQIRHNRSSRSRDGCRAL